MRFIIILIFCGLINVTVRADVITEDHIKGALDSYGFSDYDYKIKAEVGEIEGLDGMSFSDLVFNALSGKLDLSFSSFMKLLFSMILKEVLANGVIMRNIIVIALLGAILKVMSGSFSENSVNEIGFYIIYISLIALIITSFAMASQIASSSISRMASFMQALIPLIMALLVASGRYAISFVFHPAVMIVTEVAVFAIDKLVLNIIMLAAVIQMVNFLMPAGTLDNMTDLAYGLISNGFKLLAVGFMALVSIEAVAAPIAGGVVGKSAKAVVSAVPIVGGAFAGAVDSVFFWGSAIKNAAAIGAVICVLLICLIPILKLLAIAFIYMVTAAIIEPFAEERVVSLISAAGKYILLFVGAVMCVCVMFITLLMMVMAGAMG